MPKVTLTLTSGKALVMDAEPGELTTALQAQSPAYVIAREDGSRTVLNMRNVVALDYNLNPEPPAEQDAAEDADTRTVAELKAMLDKAKISYDSKAHKADLVKLVDDNKLTA